MMFSVSIDQTDYRHIINALSRLRIGVRSIVSTDVPYKMSVSYKDHLISNILSGKFSSSYSRYNAQYAQWKIDKVAHTRFLVLMHDMANAITFWKDKEGYMAGVPAGILDSGDKSMLFDGAPPRYIGAYFYFNEYGWNGQKGGKGPARPVAGPTLIEFKSSADVTKISKEAMSKIRVIWR